MTTPVQHRKLGWLYILRLKWRSVSCWYIWDFHLLFNGGSKRISKQNKDVKSVLCQALFAVMNLNSSIYPSFLLLKPLFFLIRVTGIWSLSKHALGDWQINTEQSITGLSHTFTGSIFIPLSNWDVPNNLFCTFTSTNSHRHENIHMSDRKAFAGYEG